MTWLTLTRYRDARHPAEVGWGGEARATIENKRTGGIYAHFLGCCDTGKGFQLFFECSYYGVKTQGLVLHGLAALQQNTQGPPYHGMSGIPRGSEFKLRCSRVFSNFFIVLNCFQCFGLFVPFGLF